MESVLLFIHFINHDVMKFLNTKIKAKILSVCIFSVALILIIHLVNFEKTKSLLIVQDKEEILNADLTLSPREEAIKNYLSGSSDKNVIYGGQEFSLVVYRDSQGVWDKEKKNEVHNHSNIPYDRAGIILFNRENIFWESSEFFQKIFPWSVDLIDLDDDGIDEIYVVDLNGEKLTGCSIYAYKWADNQIKLITPYQVVEGTDPSDETKHYQGRITTLTECEPSLAPSGLIDLDSDKILEIMVREYNPNNVIQAYKWDGRTYELWRELIVSSEIGLGEYKGTVNDFLRDSKIVVAKNI